MSSNKICTTSSRITAPEIYVLCHPGPRVWGCCGWV